MFFFNLFKVLEIEGTFEIRTAMDSEKLTVFNRRECMATVRTDKSDRSGCLFAGCECLTADLALILSIGTIVVIDVMMRSAAEWANSIFGNGSPVSALNRFDRFLIFPKIVFQKELPILFNEGIDDRKLIRSKLLILWRMDFVMSPLF